MNYTVPLELPSLYLHQDCTVLCMAGLHYIHLLHGYIRGDPLPFKIIQ